MNNPWTSRAWALLAAGLLASCGSDVGGEVGTNQAAADAAVANGSVGAEGADDSTTSAKAEMACPFRNLRDVQGSIEGGRLLVTGLVDAIMAGYTPLLTRRTSGGTAGVTTLDLTMGSEPGDITNMQIRHVEAGVPITSRGEIWCGGERLAQFDMIVAN